MDSFPDLSVRVTTFDRRPVAQARVTAQSAAGAAATATTDTEGRARLPRADASDLLVRVEAAGLEAQERTVSGERPERVELFMLGPSGMPFYYRGTVRVPFQPINDAVGVLLRDPDVDAASQPRVIDPEEMTARVQRLAEYPGTTLLRTEGNFAASGIAVIGLQDDSVDRDPDALLGRLAVRDEVEHAGALVQLSDEHASFLTDMVVARFADGVDDAAVARIAARHGLTPLGRFGDLGNVHRLGFGGPATYAVLDASNALAAEPEVLWAEPNLVHTIEEDAVSPTDFLFPEQWDHQIINTPGAWQVLRDADPSHTFGSPDIIIAVVDDGVDVTHPEFSGNVSNGRAKVYQVFDFRRMQPNMNVLGGYDSRGPDHGTCCASAATARANNLPVAGIYEGVRGVAGNCRLIAIRRPLTEARFAEMYLWAAGFDANSQDPSFPAQIDPAADVITNSFGFMSGTRISGLMSDTFDLLTDHGRGGRGVLLFFSANNFDWCLDVTFNRPWAMYERCFCVAASTLASDGVTERKAIYSNYGKDVDFCAPSGTGSIVMGKPSAATVHNPPASYGAHTATNQTNPRGVALPGRPNRQAKLTTSAPPGAVTVTVDTVAGLAVGQAILIGAPGAASSEGHRITAVNPFTLQVSVMPALHNAHPVFTPVITQLTAAAPAGAVTVTVGTVAGLAVGQAILIGAPGAGGSEGHRITGVNPFAKQVGFTPALHKAHPVGTPVAAGPRSYRNDFGGTSYAAPICAGTGALMLSAEPSLRWYEVRDILRGTAVKIDPQNTQTASHRELAAGRWRDGAGRISTQSGYTGPLFSEFYGYGRIDAAAAVRRAMVLSQTTTIVPRVQEFSATDAAETIRAAGLEPEFTGEEPGGEAWVWRQSPRGGARARLGDTVTLQLRTGPIQ